MADGEAELLEADRPDAGNPREVYVNGVKLDTNLPLHVVRSACESLGQRHMFRAFVASFGVARADCLGS